MGHPTSEVCMGMERDLIQMALLVFKERFYPQWAPSATAAVFTTGLKQMQLAA